MGFFYGFKLHIVVNEIGQILDFQITQANTDDRTPLKGNLLKKISQISGLLLLILVAG